MQLWGYICGGIFFGSTITVSLWIMTAPYWDEMPKQIFYLRWLKCERKWHLSDKDEYQRLKRLVRSKWTWANNEGLKLLKITKTVPTNTKSQTRS